MIAGSLSHAPSEWPPSPNIADVRWARGGSRDLPFIHPLELNDLVRIQQIFDSKFGACFVNWPINFDLILIHFGMPIGRGRTWQDLEIMLLIARRLLFRPELFRTIGFKAV